MSDKDFLVVISEMLQKQDRQAEKLDEHSGILNKHTEILSHHTEILNHQTEILSRNTEMLNRQINISNEQSGLINETNFALRQYIEISVKQFEKLDKVNEHFLSRLDQQHQFNERILDKLGDIEKALKK